MKIRQVFSKIAQVNFRKDTVAAHARYLFCLPLEERVYIKQVNRKIKQVNIKKYRELAVFFYSLKQQVPQFLFEVDPLQTLPHHTVSNLG